jgi:hypothetical protein
MPVLSIHRQFLIHTLSSFHLDALFSKIDKEAHYILLSIRKSTLCQSAYTSDFSYNMVSYRIFYLKQTVYIIAKHYNKY